MTSERTLGLWPATEAFQAYFIDRYGPARDAWLRLAAQFGELGRVWHFNHPMQGPEQEALATDCLWLGPYRATRVVVLIAGTHGVEGYAGSAIQRYLLAGLVRGGIRLPADTALLCIHALTPWGMAWYRRCDEHGIDLNRHFVDLDDPPHNADFLRVQGCLKIHDADARAAALAALQKQLGPRAYEMAVSAGQYVDAKAPFYGGRARNHGRMVIETLLEEERLLERDLCVLDLHTGLGPWACGELICDHAPDSDGARLARKQFGPAMTEPALHTSSSVPKHGLLDYAWHAGMNARSCFLTLEFGTYSTQALFDRVIDDHGYWASAAPKGPEDEGWALNRDAMLAHFLPPDADWRQAVLLRSLQVVRRALDPA